jgi:membrane protein DedA with SNARE-associated domain
MELMRETAAFIEPYIVLYGVVAVFCVIFLESLGAPLPGESMLVAASLLAERGDLSLPHLAAAVFAGAVLGDSTGYLIGRLGGRPLLQRYGPLVKLTPERLERFEDLFRRRGAFIVAGARFVVVLRQLNGLVAGSMAMPWPHFVLANVVGAAAWTAVWTVGPFAYADLIQVEGLFKRL